MSIRRKRRRNAACLIKQLYRVLPKGGPGDDYLLPAANPPMTPWVKRGSPEAIDALKANIRQYGVEPNAKRPRGR